MNHDQPESASRRSMLAQSLALAVGSIVASDAMAEAPRQPAAGASPQGPKSQQVVDVLIVGGGSAGAVMARRLSESATRNVLLLEAGRDFSAWDYPHVLSDSDIVGGTTRFDWGYDWGYATQPGYVNHPIKAVRGKVLGGSSAINGAVAIRARPQDFADWNLPGWAYSDVLPAFRRLENHDGGESGLHGNSGPLPVRQLARDDLTPMQRAFVDATLVNGFASVDDFDGANANGVGPYSMNVVNGVRVNTGMAYLSNDVRARGNLRIRGGVQVDRVLFDHDRAIGVVLASGETIHAGEVVLSAGTYGSAAILLRSGVGPQADLSTLGIRHVADLPVGLRLKDHPFYYNAYAARPDRVGAASPAIGAFLWTRSSHADHGDLDLHITATHLFPQEQSPTKAGFVLAVALTRPDSVGRLKLADRHAATAPLIDLNFLGEQRDRVRLLEGIRLARRIGATAPLSSLIDSELNPGSKAVGDDALLASARATLDTYHHPTSTAPMGPINDPHAVVDLEGRVHGVRGLRVVDASIFPDAISVATNITTIAVAEHIASRYRQ